jgi:hypothetical protein
MKEIREENKNNQLPYKEKYCKDCEHNDPVFDRGMRDKWFCFGVTTAERRKLRNIPDKVCHKLCHFHQKH